MLSLVYVSSAARELSNDELVTLLHQSREKNARLDVTGMLLYKDGNFMQVLEGPDHAVRELFEAICSDGRHRGVIRLLEQPIEEREFPGWSMAFQNLRDGSLRNLSGYSEFMNEPLDSKAFQTDPGHAQRLLQVFRKNLSR